MYIVTHNKSLPVGPEPLRFVVRLLVLPPLQEVD